MSDGATEQTKQCKKCGDTHPATREFWYFHKDEPWPPCKACQRAKDRKKPAPSPTANLPVPAPTKALARAGKQDIEDAIDTGAAILKRNSAQVMARMAKYAADPTSPHHEMAMKFMGERVAPIRRYGGDGDKGGGGGTPNVNITVVAADPRAPVALPVVQSVDVSAIPDEGANE